MRLLPLLAAAALVTGLFVMGEKPYAGSLFPAPWDKLAHIACYGTIAILLWNGTGGRFPLAIAALVLSIGLLDELHQAALPGRSADITDLIADAVGICVAFYLLRARKHALKGSP